jgi:predicted AAA+ superfamily ATPase
MPIQLLLKELIEEFNIKTTTFRTSVIRQLDFSSIPNKIKVAIGMRRTGKTYLLFQKIQALLISKVALSRILYINFEDDRLLPLTQEKLRQLLDGFYSLYPENHDHTCYLFLDEIQNVADWPIVIRRYLDSKKVEIYLTGSSAKLLSKEIATSLRGRSIATEVWPYSFSEYLIAKKIQISQKILGKITLDKLTKQLHDYIREGGFPETINLDVPDRFRLLQDYVNVVIFRDIVERHKITNTVLIKYVIKTLIKNTATVFSINKFFNDLKSQHFSVSKTTLHEYLAYIEDAYLVFTVPLYSESLRKTQTNPKKIYAVDTGLVNAYTTNFSQNWGRLFENVIFLELKRKGHDIYYYLTKERYEVDFLTKDINNQMHLYQVVWNVDDPETFSREKHALQIAEKELGISGEILTPANYFEWLLK